MQRTVYRYELVIGEDESPDGTRAICEEMARLYPDRIRLLTNERWYGQNENLYRTLKACNGKYIALCEGDDFWTDASKLQKQVDFLEAHTECVLSFHKQNCVDENERVLQDAAPDNRITFYRGKDLFHTFVGTPTVVFRNCLGEFPPEFFKVQVSTDAFLIGMLAGFGSGANLGFVGASYRMHGNGFYNRLNLFERYKRSILCRKLMYRSAYFTPEQKIEIRKELAKRSSMYIKGFLKRFELKNFARMLSFILFR